MVPVLGDRELKTQKHRPFIEELVCEFKVEEPSESCCLFFRKIPSPDSF